MIKKILITLFVCIGLIQTQVSAKKKTKQNPSTKSQDSIAELHFNVKGMVCPFCSYSLDLALKQRPYVKKVKNINLENGIIEILIKEDTNYTLDEITSDLNKTVTEATFSFDGIEKIIRK